jgi:hypothetical protein
MKPTFNDSKPQALRGISLSSSRVTHFQIHWFSREVDMTPVRLSLAFCLAGLVSVTGCGMSGGCGPDTVPATVTIKQDGHPLPGATVVFCPEASGGKGAIGTTDANGFAQMSLGQKLCVRPGSYVVTVTTDESTAPSVGATSAGDEEEYGQEYEEFASSAPVNHQRDREAKQLLPIKYASRQTSDLRAEVKEGQTNDFEFDLADA